MYYIICGVSCVLPHSECIPFDFYFIIRINIVYLSRVSVCSPKKKIHQIAATDTSAAAAVAARASVVTHFGTIFAMALDAIAVGFIS